MGRLVQVGVALLAVALLVAVVDYVNNPSGSPVRAVLGTVVGEVTRQYDRVTGRPSAAPVAEATPTPAAQPTRSRPTGAAASSPSVAPAVPAAVPAPIEASGATAPPRTPEPPPAVPSGFRQFYLPARVGQWTRYDIAVTGPVAIRAAGRIISGDNAAGPDGLASPQPSRGPNRNIQQDVPADRPMPRAPYLALIGRICSGDACSDPFLVGSDHIVCPGDVALSGHLQLWTNNHIRVGGGQTSQVYASAIGGYSFSVEPAAAAACGPGDRRAAAVTPSIDAKALAAGRTVAGQQFVLPSSQSSWKPFFLPLDMPLILQASGTMRPRNDAQPTGPEGIEVPPGPSWSYPGARDIVVDGTHRLIDPSIRYQALIGRVCDGRGCGPTFAVGRQHVLCPTGASRAWLELWINHIVGPAGLLGRSTTLSLDAFDLQTRVGEYRFSVAAAPANACVSAPVRRP